MNKQDITNLINSTIIDNDNGLITAEKMRDVLNAINEAADNINDNSVTTEKIADGSVTTEKIADGAITTDKTDFSIKNELGTSQKDPISQKKVTELYNQGYKLVGTATPSTTPITLTIDEKVFYIATEEGDYSNFGLGNISELSIIKSENGSWKVEGLGTQNSDIKAIKSSVFIEKEVETVMPVELFGGFWHAPTGSRNDDSTRKATEKIAVNAGDILYITTVIGGSTVIAYLAQWSGSTYKGVAENFTAGSGNAVDREYIVPEGITEIAVCSYNSTAPIIKKIASVFEPKFYTKEETDNKIANSSLYGVRWKTDDMDDLGERCFDAIGLNAAIGIGSTNGHSDFDNIYPWSEIKRCNIKANTNGAKIVTFEGEDSFAVDGSNGDVFVRIPKFRVQAYKEDGYEYRTISPNLGYIHPAFIEDGVELDEIFIGAFEASTNGNPYDSSSGDGKLYSKGGVIPANNIEAQTMLDMAQSKGEQYSLYDMRCVDLLWTLMSVEYGCRNSNQIIGYGYADYIQAATYQQWSLVTQSKNNTNTVTLGKPNMNSHRVYVLNSFAAGNNICICLDNQRNIIAERKIVSVACASVSDNIVIMFDGDPIDVDTTCFVGNAPASCNHCESITDTNAALSWHTGRTNRAIISGAGTDSRAYNTCRYRWIENPVGNVWHFLPDVSFNDLQMYICRNMKSYGMTKTDGDYRPVGNMLPIQEDNGAKKDINTTSEPNYWITSLVDDYFAKGVSFGKTFDEIHNGNITSAKGFGAYYYLQDGEKAIANGGGFDHLWRCNMLTNRAWIIPTAKWYLYGARLIFKNI